MVQDIATNSVTADRNAGMSLVMIGNIGMFRVTRANRAMDANETAMPKPSGFRMDLLIELGSVPRSSGRNLERAESVFGMLSCRSRTPATIAPPRKKNGTCVPGESARPPWTMRR